MRLLAAGLLLVAPFCAAFYLPGLAPVSFCEEGEESEGCKVRTLTGGPDTGGRPPRRGNTERGLPGSGFPRRGGGTAEYPPTPLRAGSGRSPSGGNLCSGKPTTTTSSLCLGAPGVVLVFGCFFTVKTSPFPTELSTQRREGPSPALGSLLQPLVAAAPPPREGGSGVAQLRGGGRGLSEVCGNSAAGRRATKL